MIRSNEGTKDAFPWEENSNVGIDELGSFLLLEKYSRRRARRRGRGLILVTGLLGIRQHSRK